MPSRAPGAAVPLHTIDYSTFADLRYQIRRFLRSRELTARAAGVADRREVVVRLRPPGETVLRKLARHSLAELTHEGPGLVASLRRLIQQSNRSRTSSSNGRGKA